MGAAMVGGAAVAFADTGADSTAGTTTSQSTDATSSASTEREAPGTRTKAVRPSRGAAVSGGTADGPSQAALSGRKGRLSAGPEIPDAAPAAAVQPETTGPAPIATDAPLPAAAVATAPSESAPALTPKRSARTARTIATMVVTQPAVDPTPPVEQSPVETAPAAAVPGPAADPAPEMDSWLPGGTNPGNQIVPGAHFALALQEIADAQGIITAQTWGSGNVFAGVAAIIPQVLLAGAALSLQAWAATNPAAQGFLAGTAGIPLIQQVAQVTLLSTMLLPSIAEASMGGAALFLPLVDLLGADVSAAQAQVAAARQDGKIYAVVPVRMVASTQPVVGVSVNGGSSATLLVDSGASGLVTTRDKVGAGDLGPVTGSGNSCFSGGLCYHYETYNTTVDLGGGAVTTAPVNIVTDNGEYPDSVANFKSFFSWGADGILGTGANTAGPGPASIPTALMPGELSNGVLLFQGLFFGIGGVMVLGPNPLPTRVSVPGAPDAYVKVSVNDGPKTDAGAIIDSGGVYGTLNRDLYNPMFAGDALPAGTKISVYTADGATLLYSYTTQGAPRDTPVIETGLFNTGNAPFAQGPVYLNYGFDDPYGIGSTDFSIW
jgi:hypothetical protein